jgi:hypothetical protein
VKSNFMAIIGALGLVLWELSNAPIGYESEDGFHFGEPGATPVEAITIENPKALQHS